MGRVKDSRGDGSIKSTQGGNIVMDSFWLILAFLSGAFVYHLATTRNSTETPVQTLKRAFTATPEPKQEDEPQHDIERALAELKPPNLFERREAKEQLEREQAELRRKALYGVQ